MLMLMAVCGACSLLLFHWAPKDRNGNRPPDVAKAFIEAVQSNDFARAASFWKPESIQNTESNFQMKFKEFCVETFKCDSYKVSVLAGRQKQSYKVGFRGRRKNGETRFGLYFERVDDEWKIAEDLWIPNTGQKLSEAEK